MSDHPSHLATPQLVNPLGFTSQAFADIVGGTIRGGRNGALEVYRDLYRRGYTDNPHINACVAPIIQCTRSDSSEGQVIKFTQGVGGEGHRPQAVGDRAGKEKGKKRGTLPDGRGSNLDGGGGGFEVESVLIPMIGRTGQRHYTLCLSSQVGCAMGCEFCETAQMGLVRSLSVAEIIGQWFAARHLIGQEIRNVVFMGMGEPMDAIETVIEAIDVLTDRNGPAVPMNKITVSTVGRIEGIRRLGEQVRTPGWHRLGLSVSLNAPNDEIRSAIMPINRAEPMAELRKAIQDWPIYGSSKVLVGYVLIPGVNDQREHAMELAEYLEPIPGLVNVIPYNPRRDSPWPAPQDEQVDQFLGWLTEAGAYCKRRRTKGVDTMAACGQLGSPNVRKRRFVNVTMPTDPK